MATAIHQRNGLAQKNIANGLYFGKLTGLAALACRMPIF